MIKSIPKNVIKLYGLPKQIKFCVKCTVSNQRPRISFDANGVCSACHFASHKKASIDWRQREEQLLLLCDRFRRKDGGYDVIVPCSGGKDGGFVAHQLKYKYGMNPLAVTWSPLRYSEIGRKNLDAFIASGFNHILGTPDPLITRKLTELSTKIVGDPFQPFIYGQTNFPLQIAVKFGIPLIMYGENGEVEYGGDMKNAHRPTRDISDHEKHYFSNFPPDVWKKYGLKNSDILPFEAPPHKEILSAKIQIHFFSYYKFWDPQENYYYCRENTGFSPNSERTEGTYSKYASIDDKFDGFHYYLGYIKFGIGRATSDSAHEIRDGKITREEGVALVKKYDGEFPQKYYQEFLDFCKISDQEFHEIVDSWRSDHIWVHERDRWKLRHPVWKDIEN